MPKGIFLLNFMWLAGCGIYGWNLPPKDSGAVLNEDPCSPSNKAEVIGINRIVPGNSQANFTIIIKSPCANISLSAGSVFSLAIYDADDFLAPNDLTTAESGVGAMSFSQACENGNIAKKAFDEAKFPETAKLLRGTAVSLFTGKKNRTSLYHFANKLSVENKIGGADCYTGTDFSPIIINQATGGSVTDMGGMPLISSQDEGGIVAAFGKKFIIMGAPYYTAGVEKKEGYLGLPSTSGISVEGSVYQFNVAVKPGKYYFVLSDVPNPSGSLALGTVKVYHNSGKSKDYVKDCGKDIRSCGSIVTIS